METWRGTPPRQRPAKAPVLRRQVSGVLEDQQGCQWGCRGVRQEERRGSQVHHARHTLTLLAPAVGISRSRWMPVEDQRALGASYVLQSWMFLRFFNHKVA